MAAFPTNPTNGQSILINGITYTYASTTRSWTRTQTGGGIFNITSDTFVGDGATISYSLSVIPAGKEFVTVNIDGVLQLKSAFDLNTNVLTFTGIPAAGAVIEIKSVANSGLTVLTGLAYDTFTGDGTTSTFTLSTYPAGKNFTMVTVGGIVQNKSNYLITNNTISFTTAPPATAPIEVTTFGPAAVTGTNAATTGKAIAMSRVFGS
jgi:hypothetical protein